MSTEKLSEAFAFAARHHAGQKKKGTSIPFIYHPMAVSSIVLQYGGTNEQAMAALLHDTIADSQVSHDALETRFGRTVADLVFAFADPEMPQGSNPDWRELREAYLAKLRSLNETALLVTASEELHDGGELLHDLRYYGRSTWDRYPTRPEEVVWYYESLLGIFEHKLRSAPPALLNEFRGMVAELRALS